MSLTILPARTPNVRPVEVIPASAAAVHELEVLHDELELLHVEVRQTLEDVERRSLNLIRDLQQTIGQHLSDHPHYPANGWTFARRARDMLQAARREASGPSKVVRASKVLDQLVEEAWVQL